MEGCRRLHKSSASLFVAMALVSTLVCLVQVEAKADQESSVSAVNSSEQSAESCESSGAETSSSQTPVTAKCTPPPAYKLLRYDEDYSYLKDPNCCTDFWDPIKYIPLGCEPSSYLSIGGEVRERYEFFHNPDAGQGPANSEGNNSDFTERYFLHGDLRIGQNFRFFGQLITGLEDGRIGGPRPDIDKNEFDAHQAFADFIAPLDDDDTLTARIGRQEMEYGSGRLIDVREGPNLRLSFDAARLLLKAGDWEIDSWWGKPVLNQPGVFDDDPNPDRSFWGLYSVHPVAWLPKGNVDLYYLGFQDEQADYVQGPGSELRHTVGARIWGNPLPWEYNLEYDWQFGTFNSGQIEAWSAANAVRYNFSDEPLKPRVGIRLDATSGDNDPNSENLQTFNPLFPSGVYFNLLNPVGPLNLIDLHPTVDLTLNDETKFGFDWDFYWRESLNDGAYRISGTPLRPGIDGARYLGSSPAATLVWDPTRHITVLISYVHFFTGPFFESNLPDKSTDYFTTWVDYKF
jgi:hypothetical protein